MTTNRVSVGLKLAVAFGALIVVLLSVGGLSLNRMAKMNAKIQEIADDRWQKVQLSRSALEYSSLNSRLTVQVFLTEDRNQLGRLLKLRAENTDKISALMKLIETRLESEEEKKLFANIWAQRTPYVESYKNALSLLLEKGQPGAARVMMEKVVLPQLIAYHGAWEAFVDLQGEQMSQAGDAAEMYSSSARHQVFGLLALATLLAGGIAVFVTRNMTRSQAELAQAHQELVVASRQAGMAEVATGILHNVNNVLNSVGVASTRIGDSLKKSKAANFSRIVGLLREHEADLGNFLTNDPKGKQIPVYLKQLAEYLSEEQTRVLGELDDLQKNIGHIKEIVTIQQRGAKDSGAAQLVNVTDLVADTLRMDSDGLARNDVEIVKEFDEVPAFRVEKHKVLQILMNLVRNARQAIDESSGLQKRITIRATREGDRVRIAVSDTGMGISRENLDRIFAHGFSTKKDGHGFGLRSAMLAAKEMDGSLQVHSEGPGHGALFTLELPLRS